MATITTKEIRECGRLVVLKHPGGIRFSELVGEVLAKHADANRTTVEAQVANFLIAAYPDELTKPSRGLYKPLRGEPSVPPVVLNACIQKEEQVYQPFAEWLKKDIEEATEAVPLGGAGLKSKWGTPDVVGVYRPLASQLIKFTPEIVAAEIKLDPAQPIVAFGQAIAYRLFASRAYVVMPLSMSEADQSRLESLCLLFGVGFVLFDPASSTPHFHIRVRAQRFSPDMFYANEFASSLHKLSPDAFQQLFG